MKSVICAAKRTPIGSFLGSLSTFTAPELGSAAILEAIKSSGFSSSEVYEAYMGCVLTAGVGQAPARQAVLGAGLPNTIPCTTIGKVCGSGLKAVMLADLAIRSGEAEGQCLIAGGMESMSQSPFVIQRMRTGLRMGNGELIDSMIKDGLWDVYSNFHMGNATEILNKKEAISREAQDAYAKRSYERALSAIASGEFSKEIVSLAVKSKKGDTLVQQDEEPFKSDLSKIPNLKPAFDSAGSVTAANASSINDGAAALILCSESTASKKGISPMARILAQAQSAQDPVEFTIAPASAIERALIKAGLKTDQIDHFEINEAFSAVALTNMRRLELDPAKVNPHGGAVALGHPIGASGARILTTLVHSLVRNKKRYGVASLCIGGGEAVAVVVENINL